MTHLYPPKSNSWLRLWLSAAAAKGHVDCTASVGIQHRQTETDRSILDAACLVQCSLALCITLLSVPCRAYAGPAQLSHARRPVRSFECDSDDVHAGERINSVHRDYHRRRISGGARRIQFPPPYASRGSGLRRQPSEKTRIEVVLGCARGRSDFASACDADAADVEK